VVEKINKNNEIRSRLTTFIAVCSRGFGGQSVVSFRSALTDENEDLLIKRQPRAENNQ
jgi:hypothetical protein